jgi:hypothetical protein
MPGIRERGGYALLKFRPFLAGIIGHFGPEWLAILHRNGCPFSAGIHSLATIRAKSSHFAL